MNIFQLRLLRLQRKMSKVLSLAAAAAAVGMEEEGRFNFGFAVSRPPFSHRWLRPQREIVKIATPFFSSA